MDRRAFLAGSLSLLALCVQSELGIARNPRGASIGTVSPGTTYKFIPGDFAQASSFYNVSIADEISDLSTVVNAGTTGLLGYSFGRAWGSMETSSSTQSMTPQYDNAGNWQRLNYLFAVWPGSYAKFYFNANRYGAGLTVSNLTSTNLGNPAGFFVPAYFMECAGAAVSVPNSPGSGSGISYAINPCYSGSSSYGCFFLGAGTSTYSLVTPAWTNPGVVKAWQNCIIYLASIATCPTPVLYSSGTSYSPGDQALDSGGICYTYINATATAGNALSNPTYWVSGTPNYGGQTMNQCAQVAVIAENDEVTYNWISSENASSGPTVNPPVAVTGAANTNTNFATLYYNRLSAICGALTQTPYACCYSFGVQIGSTADTNSNVTANVNGNMPSGDRTMPGPLSGITGLVFSTADTYGWIASSTTFYASSGQQGYLGILNPTTGGAPPTPGYASEKNAMPEDSQVQPLDLTAETSGNYNAAGVIDCMQASVVMGAHWRDWPINDVHTSGGGWSGTNGYIYATLIANQSTYPANATRPSNLP